MNAKQQLIETCNEHIKDIIQSRIKDEAHYICIANFNNFITYSCMIHGGQEKSVFNSQGFEICKKREADHYSLIEFNGITVKSYWLKKRS